MKYLAPIPKQFVDHNGLPLSDGKVHVYISGDTQYANVYQDADGEELMPNPARLDSNGAWQGFVTSGIPMDYVVEDKDGNVQFEYEKVVAGSGTANVAIEPTITSGTKIAECWVDGELLELFAPEGGGGSSTIHHLAAGQYGYLIDMDNNGNIVTDQVLDSWMRDNEDVVLYDIYADASGYSNKPYMVQWYDASSTFTEGSTKIRFSRVGDSSTPAKLTLYGFASNSEGYMKSAPISGHASPWTVDVNVGTQVQSNWSQSDNTKVDYIKNKPVIPARQVNSDWAAVGNVEKILNKPMYFPNTSTNLSKALTADDISNGYVDFVASTSGHPSSLMSGITSLLFAKFDNFTLNNNDPTAAFDTIKVGLRYTDGGDFLFIEVPHSAIEDDKWEGWGMYGNWTMPANKWLNILIRLNFVPGSVNVGDKVFMRWNAMLVCDPGMF